MRQKISTLIDPGLYRRVKLEAVKTNRQISEIVGEALEHVRRGLKLASHREKPYLFMGRLYKAIGRADVAEKMFTRAVHIQPECVEALRELRLINMRREKSKGLVRRLLRR